MVTEGLQLWTLDQDNPEFESCAAVSHLGHVSHIGHVSYLGHVSHLGHLSHLGHVRSLSIAPDHSAV